MKLGICVGTVSPALSKLKFEWAYGVAANALSDEFLSLPKDIEFVPLTFENEPQAFWKRFLLWEQYQHYWLIGSEPRTNWDNNKTVEQIAPIFMRQMDYIKGFDPDAKFIVTCSTQGQFPYNRHSNLNFIGDLWALFPQQYRDWTTGFHMHIYPRWISDDPNIRWSVRYLVDYIRAMRRWMNENDVSDRELWISEFGFEQEFSAENNPKDYANCVTYLKKLLRNQRINEWVTRLAFYVGTERPNSDGGGSNYYLPLLDMDGTVNALGKVWNRVGKRKTK